MRKWLGLCAIALACFGLGESAIADDSEAELGIGGLRFTRTNDVAMVSEDLFLSADQVRIRYVFHNRTTHDITTLVAFPLPDISPDYYFEPVAIPNTGDPNFVQFETRADGRRLDMTPDQRAKLHGQDITARLRAAGLPLSPIDPHFNEAVRRMASAARLEALHSHWIEDTSGDKNDPAYRGLWSLSTTFSRTQTFPAGRDVVVEQSYTPIVGGSVASNLMLETTPKRDRNQIMRQYCVDDAFMAAARQALARSGERYIAERRLAYVLRTGANWAGPIGRFHLIVDKGDPRNLISLCAPGIERASPTRFELTLTNYTPREDINILILTPPEAPTH